MLFFAYSPQAAICLIILNKLLLYFEKHKLIKDNNYIKFKGK